jgi:hypothetical protein
MKNDRVEERRQEILAQGAEGFHQREGQIIAADDLYGEVGFHFNRVQLLPSLQVRIEAYFPRKRACLRVEPLDKVVLVG